MSVEYIPFDPTLIGKEEIIIWCPDKTEYASLAELLEEHGVQWVGGEQPTAWSGYEGSYNARNITANKYMMRASIAFYETDSDYRRHIFMKWPPEQEVIADVGDLI